MATLDDVRRDFTTLQTMSDRFFWVEHKMQDVRRNLAALKCDASALDPAGKKSTAEMEGEIDQAVRSALIKGVRKEYKDVIGATHSIDVSTRDSVVESISKSLQYLGADYSVLDESGRSSAAEVEKNLTEALDRRCLMAARKKYDEYVAANVPGWANLTDHLEGQIMLHLKAAGAPVEALDPTGASTAADIAAALKGAREHLNLIAAREAFTKYKDDPSIVYADHPETLEKTIRDHLAAAGKGLDALDASGKSSADDVRQSLDIARWKLRVKGACEIYTKLGDIAEDSPFLPGFENDLKKLRKLLKDAGADAAVLDQTLLRTAPEMEQRLATVESRLHFRLAKKELADFEAISAPRALSDVYTRVQRITDRFNAGSARFEYEISQDPGVREKIQDRLEKAVERAREMYYANGGAPPVMKKLKIVPRNTSSGA